MTLRTPRRRISPRTKLRYRAIRQFFRRAVGSASQQDIKINSSITVSVTDLKRKIVGLEQQLDEVSKHCRDIACLDNYSRRTSESFLKSELKQDISKIKELTEPSTDRTSNVIETQHLYKSSESNNKKSDDSDSVSKSHNDNPMNEHQVMVNEYDGQVTKAKNKKSKLQMKKVDSGFHKHKTRSVSDNIGTSYTTSSFHSLANNQINHHHDDYLSYSYNRNLLKQACMQELMSKNSKDINCKINTKKNIGDNYKELKEGKPVRVRKTKQLRELDQDFIADIIRRQYKPLKMFGPKESDLSQFSAPICRDQELSMQENVPNDSELRSYAYDAITQKRSKHRRDDLNIMRSVCDARIYSSKNQLNHRHVRVYDDDYSNSNMYDLVPVKERASPKIRRKFIEDTIAPYDHYREVPPSPRTLRPRLNLKAQYYTDIHDDYQAKNQFKRRSPSRQKSYQECVANFPSELSEVLSEKNVKSHKPYKPMKVLKENHLQNQNQQDIATMSNLQYPQYVNEQTSIIDTSLNKTQETEISVDKTDRALSEIKDILQNFLLEIKKENIASQCDKSDITCQDNTNVLHDTINTKSNSNAIPNSASFNNYNMGQCGLAAPYVTPINNSCCYPIVPLCPLNCPVTLPGGYLVPNQSYACMNCGNVPKESNSTQCCSKSTEPSSRTETEELIKEIYKFVAQGPIKKHDSDSSNNNKPEDTTGDAKILTSRSVGGSYGNFHQDANVGTKPLMCYSRSCEAIGSRMTADPCYNQTDPSCSDTVLEKFSLEVTQSTSETEVDTTDSYSRYKTKGRTKFSRMLQSFGFFKKKKKDVIEELSESESVIDVDVHRKQSPPFRQEITNYMMHSQDYYYPPPVESLYPNPHEYQLEPCDYQLGSYDQSDSRDYKSSSNVYPSRPQEYQPRPHQYEYQSDYQPPYNPGVGRSPSPQLGDPYTRNASPMRERTSPVIQPTAQRPTAQRPTAPPFNSSYDSSFSGMQQPLYLKEIEVKSTATQSERKMSLFHKIKKRMQLSPKTTAPALDDQHQRSFSTQTPQTSNKPYKNTTKPLINWKKLQSKAMQGIHQDDPIAYSLKTQKELAEDDLKLKKAMLKKLFHKKNPFSPGNLIMKTLLGKDKSSFGNPPTILRPRMFF